MHTFSIYSVIIPFHLNLTTSNFHTLQRHSKFPHLTLKFKKTSRYGCVSLETFY